MPCSEGGGVTNLSPRTEITSGLPPLRFKIICVYTLLYSISVSRLDSKAKLLPTKIEKLGAEI